MHSMKLYVMLGMEGVACVFSYRENMYNPPCTYSRTARVVDVSWASDGPAVLSQRQRLDLHKSDKQAPRDRLHDDQGFTKGSVPGRKNGVVDIG